MIGKKKKKRKRKGKNEETKRKSKGKEGGGGDKSGETVRETTTRLFPIIFFLKLRRSFRCFVVIWLVARWYLRFRNSLFRRNHRSRCTLVRNYNAESLIQKSQLLIRIRVCENVFGTQNGNFFVYSFFLFFFFFFFDSLIKSYFYSFFFYLFIFILSFYLII